MKKLNILLIIIIVGVLSSCEDKYTEIFMGNSPVYMSYEELRLAVKQSTAQELNNPGKMYFKDNYIFIVEEMEGIHIIDNSDPANPENITFIEIPGSVDIAIKGTILYADSYVDLVAIDISDLNSIEEVNRIEDVLPYTLPPYDEDYPLSRIDEEKGVVTGWEIKKVRQEVENRYYPRYYEMDWALSSSFANFSSGGIGSNGIGIGGSMARFGIAENTLYAIDNSMLYIFNITTPSNPVNIKEFYAGWNIETMFILEDNMFLGTQNGMRIYDISVPASPMYVSQFWHVTSCDPVVVQDTLAYVTLRGGTSCWNDVNELDVISIANIEAPYLLKAHPMEEPYGLGIDDNILFICDAGLKIYDATDPLTISDNLLATFPSIEAYDVIPLGENLLLIGDDGLYQYDYSDVQNIQLLSTIAIVSED